MRRSPGGLHEQAYQCGSFRDCSGRCFDVRRSFSGARCADNCCRAAATITLAATVGELKNLRLARPLSRDEEAALRSLDHFKECELCPEMIVVPAGYFLMGAKDGEPGSTPDERPQHEVYFAQPFSVGRFPVTFSEWDACVAARGCSYQPTDQA